MSKNLFAMSFKAEKSNLAVARNFVSTVISSYFSKDEAVPLEMCVNELCENIVRHAYNENRGSIRIEIKVEEGQVKVTVEDKGPQFDLREYMPMTNDELVEQEVKGKLGIRVIKKICDAIHYSRVEDRNVTEIIKKRAAV